MTFKEQIAADLDIFVETEEFAELVTIDGVELPAQKISHTAEKSARLTEQWDKLFGDFMTLYFKRDDYNKKIPVQGQGVIVDGRRYDVLSSEAELGLVKLVLSAYRQPRLK